MKKLIFLAVAAFSLSGCLCGVSRDFMYSFAKERTDRHIVSESTLDFYFKGEPVYEFVVINDDSANINIYMSDRKYTVLAVGVHAFIPFPVIPWFGPHGILEASKGIDPASIKDLNLTVEVSAKKAAVRFPPYLVRILKDSDYLSPSEVEINYPVEEYERAHEQLFPGDIGRVAPKITHYYHLKFHSDTGFKPDMKLIVAGVAVNGNELPQSETDLHFEGISFISEIWGING